MKIYLKKSKSKQEHLYLNGKMNLNGISESLRTNLVDFLDILRIREREIGRNNLILDLLAKALVQNDAEYSKCKRKFRRTRIWDNIADQIEVSMIHKYRFYIRGLKKAFEDRDDVILTFLECVGAAFNRTVHIEEQTIGKDTATMVIFKPEFGQPIIPKVHSFKD